MGDNGVRQSSGIIDGGYRHHHFGRNFFLELYVILERGMNLARQSLNLSIPLVNFRSLLYVYQEKLRIIYKPRDLSAPFSFDQEL